MLKGKKVLSTIILLAMVAGLFMATPITSGAIASGYSYIVSRANSNIVSADNTGSSPLVANRATAADWESFKIINNSDGTVSFQALANNLYVCADLNQSNKLIARSTIIDQWEKFRLEPLPDGTVAIFALANNQYVCTDLNNGAVLYANRASVGGAWEAFSIVTPAATAPGTPSGLATSSTNANSVSLVWSAVAGATGYNVYRSSSSTGTFTKVNTSAVASTGYTDTGLTVNTTYYYKVSAVNSIGESALSAAISATTVNNPTAPPDFGPNVFIFDPSMSASTIQSRCNTVFSQQEENQYGSERYALLFKPGSYNVDVNVGFFTQVMGLGQSPDSVNINGAVRAEADWFSGNATQNFWRSIENLAVTPSSGTNRWAVSQAAPFRRMHIKGSLVLDDGGWSSGGFISDSKIDGQINSGSQQQWFTRNSQLGSWAGSNWNMVFAGVVNAPSGNWPSPPYTVVNQVPVVREKPFLYIDGTGNYNVLVPSLRTNSQGITWAGGSTAGESIPISQFYIAKSGVDTAATINAALSQGKNLLLTPGVYHLNDTIRVTRANTVVLGLGLATLIPDNGSVAMTVADVDGVKIAGILFDAGAVNSPILLEVGPTGSSLDHSVNPTSLHDVFFRVGGSAVGKATVSAKINSNNVIGDHFWVWRGDHTYGVGWNVNTTTNGLIVNGNDVTIYGLFVEHYHQYQTLWNGNRGRVYFYQSEIPYDVPNQSSWMNGSVNGYASYKVANSVTNHEAWGLGIYCYFSTNPSVKLNSAIEAPNASGVKFHHVITVSLGGKGEITHIINNTGNAANSSGTEQRLNEYP